MEKIAIVYWSGTGNTESMAGFVKEGVEGAGAEADIFTASDFSVDLAATYHKIAFGCPSMGDEQLEESEFEPMFSSIESSLSGKKVALFGSYGWGDGEWMRSWEQTVSADGAKLVGSTIANEAPDDEAAESCRALGASLANA